MLYNGRCQKTMLKLANMETSTKQPEDTTQILKQIVDTVRFLLGCDKASVVLWNASKKDFEVSASSEEKKQSVAQRVRREGGATRWIIDNQKPLLINDVNLNPFSPNEVTIEGGIQAFLGVPISREDRHVGVLYALSLQPLAFTKMHVNIMVSLSNMAAVAIENAQLVEEQRELNAFKDAMMGLAAHDLRNPLSRIAGYFGLFAEDFAPFDEVHQPWVDEVFRAINETHDLIDGIMDYERISQAANPQDYQSHSLNEIVAEVAQKSQYEADKNNQKIIVELSSQPIVVDMDSLLIREAISNLVLNALKYSAANTTVTIQTEITDKDYRVIVIDEGTGIAPEDQPKIFEPFMRLQSAKSQRGSGLGLNLVKTIIAKHGGCISLASEVGTGSTFTIHFPRLKSD